ncbi:MAG: hypothetical protein VKM34_11080 [Cyanobacteriota bacterium]|nr:hypothetical protein [Cyanobacteriota bacterium]
MDAQIELSQIELTVAQKFEIERFSRAIDANVDAEQLRSIAKQLLQAWHTQKAATNWVIQQQLGQPLIQLPPPQG